MIASRRQRIERILSLAEVRAVPPALLGQLRAQGVYPPIAGGSVPPLEDGDPGGEGGGTPDPPADADSDEEDDAADDDETDDDTEPDTSASSKGKKAKGRSAKPDEDGDGYVRMPRSEIQRLRRESREARNALKQRESEERVAKEKAMADQEKWKDLAESREERISELEGEIEALKMEGTKNTRKANIVKVAKRLGFEYPDDAHMYLDIDDMEDEQSIEFALKSVLRDRPKLKSRRRGSGAPIPGESEDDGKGGLTKEEIEKMSPEEINKRWPEVQAFLRKQEVAAS